MAHSIEPACIERVQSVGSHAVGSHWRSVQPAERKKPVDVRGESAEQQFPSANRVLRRLPESRAARRTDRVPLLLLVASRSGSKASKTNGGRGASGPRARFLLRFLPLLGSQ